MKFLSVMIIIFIFGGISILVFGDLYQLPPVMSKMIFDDMKNMSCMGVHIWTDLFTCVELNEIMRQKDDISFAELLNRIRIGRPSEEDIEILKTRILTRGVNYPLDALHVFATNAECDRHNNSMLINVQKGTVMYSIDAKDRFANVEDSRICKSKDERRTRVGQLMPDDVNSTGGLPTKLQLCIGCRVMLKKNINVQDGLVNGSLGSVVGFALNGDENEISTCRPLAVFIKFDDVNSGKVHKSAYNLESVPGAVAIGMTEVKFVGKN